MAVLFFMSFCSVAPTGVYAAYLAVALDWLVSAFCNGLRTSAEPPIPKKYSIVHAALREPTTQDLRASIAGAAG